MVLVTGVAIIVGVAIVAISAKGSAPAPDRSPDSAGLVRPSTELPLELAHERTIGKADAPATLEIWSDFQCPACGRLVREVEPRLIADYVIPGYLRIVYRDRAFLGDESVAAAVAGRCAAAQGEFWQYHDYLFFNQDGENNGAFRRERLLAMADAVGLTRGAFETCLDSPEQRQAVSAETEEGAGLGVATTPTLAIGGQLLPGAPVSTEQYAALGRVLRLAIEQGGGTFLPSPGTP